jgi:hypothetical protein
LLPPAPLIIGASVAGPLHDEIGLPCQDAFRHEAAGKRAVIAVADGLGSAARADVGARLAVEAAVVASNIAKPTQRINLSRVSRRAVEAARRRLETQAAETSEALRDYACTIIVVATDGARACVAHVGDGAVVGASSSGLVLLSGPGDSEYANEVEPLTSPTWSEALRCSKVFTDLQAVAVFTDGCQRAGLRRAGDKFEPYDGFFRPLISFVQQAEDASSASDELTALLRGPKMSEHSEDDKTLVLGLLRRVDDAGRNPVASGGSDAMAGVADR